MREAKGCEEKKCAIKTISANILKFDDDIDQIRDILAKESIGLWFFEKRILEISRSGRLIYFYEFNFENEVDALYFKMMFS